MNTYKMKLEDSVDSMIFDLLEVPIVDKDVEGAVDNTTVDGNVFTDYLWLKKNYVQKWSIMCDDEYSQLRGFYTRQFDNASVPTYKLYTGQNLSEDFIASGKYIMVDNTTDYNAPINSFQLLGDAEQTTYSGKNLFDMDAFLTAGGATYTKNGNVFSLTDMGNLYASPQPLNLTNGVTYTFSQVLQTQSSTNVRFDILKNGSVFASCYADQSANLVKTFTADSSTYTIRLNYSTRVYPVLFNSPMLEASATKTAYEPYVGGTASPNPDYPQAVNVVTGEQTVTITGKNLLKPMARTTTSGGINYEWKENGDIVISNTATGTSWFRSAAESTTQFDAYLGAGTYAFTVFGDTIGASFRLYDETGTYITTTQTSTSFTLTEPTKVGLQIRVASGTTTNITAQVQLELGSTATTYEPYQGQSYEINLGKNLFDKYNLTQRNINYVSSWSNSGGIITINPTGSGALLNLYLSEPLPAGDYILKSDTPLPTETTLRASGGTNGAILATISGATEQTFSLASPAVCICFIVQGTQSGTPYTIDLSSLIIESGSTYFTPLELAKIGNYQDYIFNDNGTWKIHKEVGKVVLDGTNADITWSLTAQSGAYNFWFRNNTMGALDERHEKLCDNFTYSPLAFNNGAPTPSLCENQYNSAVLTIFKTDGTQGTTVADWRTWLGSHPTTVYYALATPTTTEITNQALIDQLNAIQNAYLYTGTNNISNSSVNLAGDIDLGYTLIYEKENIIIPQTSVRLTLTDGGVINVCGCRQNVQLGMRETIQ